MVESFKEKQGGSPSGDSKPRWRRILDLPGGTSLYDLSTGKTYRVEGFAPVYVDKYENKVETFRHIANGEHVHVNFLRLSTDGRTCSLMRKAR